MKQSNKLSDYTETKELGQQYLKTIREYADKKGKEYAQMVFNQQVEHSTMWRDYLAGKIELTIPGYEGP